MLTIENVLHNEQIFCDRLNFSLETYDSVKPMKNLLSYMTKISCDTVNNSKQIIETLLKNVVAFTTIGVLDYEINEARNLKNSISKLNDLQFEKVVDEILMQ